MAYDPERAHHQTALTEMRLGQKTQKEALDREQKDMHFVEKMQKIDKANALKQQAIDQRYQFAQDRQDQKERYEATKVYIEELKAQAQPALMELAHDLQLKILGAEEEAWFNREQVLEEGRRYEFGREEKRLALLHKQAEEIAKIALRADLEIVREQTKLNDTEALRVRTHEIELIKLQHIQAIEIEYEKHLFVIEAKAEESNIRKQEMLAEFEAKEKSLKEEHNRQLISAQDDAYRTIATYRETAKIDMIREKFTADLSIRDREHQTDETLRLEDGMVDVRHRERLLIRELNQTDQNTAQPEPEKASSEEAQDPLKVYRSE